MLEWQKIPSRNITRDDTKKLKDLDKSLKRMVFGQDKAIEEIATSIRLSELVFVIIKPIGSYLFAGSTESEKLSLQGNYHPF